MVLVVLRLDPFFSSPLHLFFFDNIYTFFMKRLINFVWDLCVLVFAFFCLNFLIKLFFDINFFYDVCYSFYHALGD
jgi:hypothetical protein